MSGALGFSTVRPDRKLLKKKKNKKTLLYFYRFSGGNGTPLGNVSKTQWVSRPAVKTDRNGTRTGSSQRQTGKNRTGFGRRNRSATAAVSCLRRGGDKGKGRVTRPPYRMRRALRPVNRNFEFANTGPADSAIFRVYARVCSVYARFNTINNEREGGGVGAGAWAQTEFSTVRRYVFGTLNRGRVDRKSGLSEKRFVDGEPRPPVVGRYTTR